MMLEEHITFLDALDGKLKLCFDTHNPVMYGTGYPPDMIEGWGRTESIISISRTMPEMKTVM